MLVTSMDMRTERVYDEIGTDGGDEAASSNAIISTASQRPQSASTRPRGPRCREGVLNVATFRLLLLASALGMAAVQLFSYFVPVYTDPWPATLGFIHVPKCGGTSLWDLISSSTLRVGLRPQTSTWQSMNQTERDDTDVFGMGHINYYRLLNTWKPHRLGKEDAAPTFVTQLRKPEDRIVSHYYFAKKDHTPWSKFIGDKTLAEIIDDGDILDGYTLSFFVDPSRYPFEQVDGNMMKRCCFNETHLEEAKELLRSKFAVVGILEDPVMTRVVLECRVPWINHDEVMPHAMTTKHEIPSYDEEAMSRATAIDTELYEFSKQLLNEQYQECQAKAKMALQWKNKLRAWFGVKPHVEI